MEKCIPVGDLSPGRLVRLLYSPVKDAIGVCVWAQPREVEAADPTKRKSVYLGFLLITGRLVNFDWHPMMRVDLLDD